MAISRKSQNAYARKYYHDNADYRKKKIEDRAKYYQKHKKSEAEKSKDYYWDNPNYRSYKIAYARKYRLSHRKKK